MKIEILRASLYAFVTTESIKDQGKLGLLFGIEGKTYVRKEGNERKKG